jgi:NAD+ kinase
MKEDISFAIVVGGDGTILKCARAYAKHDIPIFGFNVGRLGFLAQAKSKDIDLVAAQIYKGEFRIEDRIMLECEVNGKTRTALNDMVIRGAVFSRTSMLQLFINGNLTSSYLADGLIIATPTGSTAYALSAGGPVIAPSLECFAIVAICPHTLAARPIVLPSSEIITVKMCENSNKFQINADGQEGVEIAKEITIKKSAKSAKLLLLERDTDLFYTVLRKKMHWGKAPEK